MKPLLTTLIIILIVAPGWTQTPPGPFLNDADIDRFIATSADMMAEFATIEEAMAEDEDEGETYEEILASYNQALKNNEAIEIIEKYGWEVETYGEKMMAIATGTTYLITVKYMKDMPEEQRAMMEEMFVKQARTLVHPDDLNVIKPRIDELEVLFKDLE